MGPDILKMDNVLIFVIFFVIFNTSSCVPLLSEMTGSGPNPPPPKRTVAKVPIQEPSLLTKSQVKAGMRKNLLGPGAAPPVKEQQVLNKAGPAPDMRIPMDNPLLGAQIDAMLAEASLQGLDPTNIFQNPAFGMQLDNMLKNMPMAPKRKVAKLPVQDPSTLTRSQVKAGLRKNLLASGDVPVEPVVKKQHTLNKAGTSSDLSTSMDNPFIGAQLDAMLSQASMPGFDPTSALQSPAFGEQFDKMLRSLPMGQLASLDFLNSPLSKIMSGNVQTPMAIHSHPAEISVKPLDRARLSPGSSSKPKVLPTQSSKDGGIFALEPTGQKIGHINPGTTIKQMDVKTNPKSMPELHTGPRSDSIIAAEKGKKVPAQITKSEVKQVNTEQYTKTRNTEQVMKTMPVLNIAPGVKDVNKIKPVQGLKPGTDQISSVDLKPTEIKNSLKPKTSGIDNMPLFSQEAGIYPNTMAKKSGAFSTNRAFPGSQQVDQMHFRTGDVNKHDISPLIHTDFSKGTVHSHANILQTPMQSGSKGAFSYVQHPLPDMSKQPKMYKSPTLKNKVGAASGEMIQPIKQPEVAGSLTPKNKVGAVFGEMIPPVKQPKVAKSLTPKNDARAVLGEIIQSVKQPKEVKSSMTKNNIDTVLDEMVKLVKPPSLPPGLDTPMSKIPEAPMLPLPDTVHVNIEPSLPGVSWANVGDGITRNKPPMDTSYSSMQKSQQPSVKKSILKKPKPCRLKGNIDYSKTCVKQPLENRHSVAVLHRFYCISLSIPNGIYLNINISISTLCCNIEWKKNK